MPFSRFSWALMLLSEIRLPFWPFLEGIKEVRLNVMREIKNELLLQVLAHHQTILTYWGKIEWECSHPNTSFITKWTATQQSAADHFITTLECLAQWPPSIHFTTKIYTILRRWCNLYLCVFAHIVFFFFCSPSILHPGPMQGWKSWVWGHGTLRSSCAFSILCLILRPFSHVALLHADHGDQPE